MNNSDLAMFGFSDDIMLDLWGCCDDGKKVCAVNQYERTGVYVYLWTPYFSKYNNDIVHGRLGWKDSETNVHTVVCYQQSWPYFS